MIAIDKGTETGTPACSYLLKPVDLSIPGQRLDNGKKGNSATPKDEQNCYPAHSRLAIKKIERQHKQDSESEQRHRAETCAVRIEAERTAFAKRQELNKRQYKRSYQGKL
jgi:hypothetical protein